MGGAVADASAMSGTGNEPRNRSAFVLGLVDPAASNTATTKPVSSDGDFGGGGGFSGSVGGGGGGGGGSGSASAEVSSTRHRHVRAAPTACHTPVMTRDSFAADDACTIVGPRVRLDIGI